MWGRWGGITGSGWSEGLAEEAHTQHSREDLEQQAKAVGLNYATEIHKMCLSRTVS
jgi:hypothetical protein